MRFRDAEFLFSGPRLARYVSACAGDQEKALSLYKANLRLAEAFYTPLCVLEVALRNALDMALIRNFSDPDWLKNQQSGFMVDSSLTYTDKNGDSRTNNVLLKAAQAATQIAGRGASHGKRLAELSFGFWTELFSPTHFKLLRGSPLYAFPNLPHHVKRVNVYNQLTDIRRFRNRIYHYEPICFSSNIYSITQVEDAHQQTLKTLNWLDPKLASWILDIDNLPQQLILFKQAFS